MFFVSFVAMGVLGVIMCTAQTVRWARTAESADGARNRALYGGFVVLTIIVLWVVMGATFMNP